MVSYTTLSVRKELSEKLSALAGAFRKDKSEIVSDLVEALLTQWQNQIKRELKAKGQINGVYVYDLGFGRILVAPKLRAISKKVPMDSKPISVKEIEKEWIRKNERTRGQDE